MDIKTIDAQLDLIKQRYEEDVAYHITDKFLTTSKTRLNESQIKSYNQLITVGISNILKSFGNWSYHHKDDLWKVIIRKFSISKPQMEETNGLVHKLSIAEARFRDATYTTKVHVWIDVWVFSKKDPTTSTTSKKSSASDIDSRTLSKAKRIRGDLVEDTAVHQMVKKHKKQQKQHEQEQEEQQQQQQQQPSFSLSLSSSYQNGMESDNNIINEIKEAGDEQEHEHKQHSPLASQWEHVDAYQAKLREGQEICKLTDKERAEYKYLIRFEHHTKHRLCELPVLVGSIPCHSTDDLTRSQECLFVEGGMFLINGKDRPMMRTPRLTYDYVFIRPAAMKKFEFCIEVRSSHPNNKYRSTSTIKLFMTYRKKFMHSHMLFQIPYIQTLVPLSVLIRAMNMQDDEFEAAVCYTLFHLMNNLQATCSLPFEHFKELLHYSFQRGASLCKTQEDAFIYLGKRSQSEDTMNTYRSQMRAKQASANNNNNNNNNNKRNADENVLIEAQPDLKRLKTNDENTFLCMSREKQVQQQSSSSSSSPSSSPPTTTTTVATTTTTTATTNSRYTQETSREELIRLGRATVSKEVLPHMGYDISQFGGKAMYLAYMVARALLRYVGVDIDNEDDQHDLKNKRFLMCGDYTSASLRQHLLYFFKSARKNHIAAIHSNQPIYIPTIYDHERLTKSLLKSWATGIFTARVPPALACSMMGMGAANSGRGGNGARGGSSGGNFKEDGSSGGMRTKDKTGICQIQNNTNINSILSQQQRICGSVQAGGGNSRARQIFNDWGPQCFVETPEGPGCGMIKPLTIFARCSTNKPSPDMVDAIVSGQYDVVSITTIAQTIKQRWIECEQQLKILLQQNPNPNPNQNQIKVKDNREVMVMADGRWTFMAKPLVVHAMHQELARTRYALFGDAFLSLSKPKRYREFSIKTDSGRLVRPLLVVDRLCRLLAPASQHDKRPLWKALTLEMMLQEGFVQYVDKDEEEDILIAMTAYDLVLLGSPIRGGLKYTHMEIMPMLALGTCASQIVFAEHNQSPRNTYQCLSSDHEVLTRTGWRSIDDITKGEWVMTFNTITNEQEWNQVEMGTNPTMEGEEILKYKYDGPLYRLTSTHMDAVCNDQHRWYLNTKDNPTVWQDYTVNEILQKQFVNKGHHSIPLVSRNTNPNYGFPELEFLKSESCFNPEFNLDWCRFIGLVLADGGIRMSGVVVVSQKKQYRVNYVSRLLSRLRAYEPTIFQYTEGTTNNQNGTTTFCWIIKCEALYQFFLPMMHGPTSFNPQTTNYDHAFHRQQSFNNNNNSSTTTTMHDFNEDRRWIYYDWMFLLSEEQARAFLEGFMVVDNDDDDDNIDVLQHSSLPLIHDLTVIGMMANTRVNVTTNHSKATVTNWRISFSFEESEQVAALPKPILYDNPEHNGYIYCLKVKNGNFCARRTTTYQSFFTGNSGMGKQAMGPPFYSTFNRVDTMVHALFYPSRPLVRTNTLQWLRCSDLPSGTDVFHLIGCIDGYNQEDSTIHNQSSWDRGLFRSIQTSCTTAQEQKHGSTHSMERIAKPSRYNCLGMKPGSYLNLDEDGLPFVGTPMKVDDILIGRITPLSKISPTADVIILDENNPHKRNKQVVDSSIPAIPKTSGIVSQVIVSSDTKGIKKVKVKVTQICHPSNGDKFSSRHGQKGTCGKTYHAHDLPVTASGMRPDLIVNPHAIPSRMTIAHLMEVQFGKAAAANCTTGNASAFTKAYKKALDLGQQHADTLIGSNTSAIGNHVLSLQPAEDRIRIIGMSLQRHGFQKHANERMYLGTNGKLLGQDGLHGHGQMFFGPIHYQKLTHLVKDKLHARARGPRHLLTKQPIEGGTRHGGFRFGEMEVACTIAYGTAYFLQERLGKASDARWSHFCSVCGNQGKAYIADQFYYCNVCKRSDTVKKVPTCESFKYFIDTLRSMAIWPRIELK